jgi:hypothetical protein
LLFLKWKLLLSKAERDYLSSVGSSLQISDGYSRVIKSRLQRKIERFASEELPMLIEKGLILSSMLHTNDVTEFRNRSVTKNCNTIEGEGSYGHTDNDNKNGAGSGIFVSPSLSGTPKDGREGNISNPRVLSDMGLAIPRPTRLGDPRSSEFGALEIIILLLLGNFTRKYGSSFFFLLLLGLLLLLLVMSLVDLVMTGL